MGGKSPFLSVVEKIREEVGIHFPQNDTTLAITRLSAITVNANNKASCQIAIINNEFEMRNCDARTNVSDRAEESEIGRLPYSIYLYARKYAGISWYTI